MNKSLHRSSIQKYRCEKKTALPILEWGIHSEIFNWWRWRDSNPRPSDYDSPALPTELHRLGEKGVIHCGKTWVL